MSYAGRKRGSRKVLKTVRIVHNGSGQAQMSLDGGALGALTTLNLSTYFEIFNSTDMNEAVNLIEVFDSTGEVMHLGTGGTDGAGNPAADIIFQITPGGNGLNYVRMDSATRLSIKAGSNVPSANTETVINFFD